MLLTLFIFALFSGFYTWAVFVLGMSRGKQRLYEAALEMQRRQAAGEDLGLEACLEKNARTNCGKVFCWGQEALPGLRFYGLCFMGFQVGYWDRKW